VRRYTEVGWNSAAAGHHRDDHHAALYEVRRCRIDPMQLNLKPHGIERLKLECDDPLSNFAFNFNLRRYNEVTGKHVWRVGAHYPKAINIQNGPLSYRAASFGLMVGRCRLTV